MCDTCGGVYLTQSYLRHC